jgi:outer membrane protein TolC
MKNHFKKLISAACCLAMVFSLVSAAAAEEDTPEKQTVDLSNIYELAFENNANAKIADLNLKAFYDGLEDLQDSLDAAWAMAGMPGEAGAYGSQLLRQLMPMQVSSESRQSTELGIESAKKQVALGGQSLLVAYYGLLAQKDGLEASKQPLDRGLSSAKVMLSLGMVTEDSVSELERSRQQLDAALQQLENAAVTLQSKLALYVGKKEDVMEIAAFGGIPGKEADADVAAVDYDADLALAEENCYALKIQAFTVADASGIQKDIEQITLSSMKSEFPAAFHEAYLALQEKAAALAIAESSCSANDRALEVATLKLSLGMISQNAYEDAKAQVEAGQSSLILAQLDFISAQNTYAAMVDGIWQQGA